MKDTNRKPTPEEFAKFVAAALRVDPKGISGKHRRELQDRELAGSSEPDSP